jgi:hypothetical protein
LIAVLTATDAMACVAEAGAQTVCATIRVSELSSRASGPWHQGSTRGDAAYRDRIALDYGQRLLQDGRRTNRDGAGDCPADKPMIQVTTEIATDVAPARR